MKQTKGQYIVRVVHNPAKSSKVDQLKQSGALLIDQTQDIPIDPTNDEIQRLKRMAIEHIEIGTMLAVKAATTPKRE